MTGPIPEKGSESGVLNQIQEGMKVYDREGAEIGKVARVYLGAVSREADERGEGPATSRPGQQPTSGPWPAVTASPWGPAPIPDAFDAGEQLSEVLRERLLRHGFIRIDSAGLFAADRYVTPDQIALVSEDRVQLNVTRNELIER